MDNKDLILTAMHTAGAADASVIAAKSVSGEADGTALIAAEEQIPTWRQRDYTDVPIGTPYKYGDQVYKLWQAHDATNQPDWTPDKAVSLWDICHTTDPAKAKPYVTPQGTRGMYQIGDVCTEGGKLYRSTMENNVWEPSAYPQGWKEIDISGGAIPQPEEPQPEPQPDPQPEPEPEEPTPQPEPEPEEPTEPDMPTYPEFVQPTGSHDAYKQGDRVTYEGKVYESLIGANVWDPITYPQGWKEITDENI